MKRLLTLTIIAVGLLSSAASAHPTPSSNPTAMALERAERYWGDVPCGGHVTITTTSVVPWLRESAGEQEGLEAGGVPAMWTSWSSPSGSNVETDSPATYANCTITVNETLWPGWREMDVNFQEYCDQMTHEVGHLFGHDDVGQTDQNSIEYPALGLYNFNSVPQCRGVTLYYGHESFRDLSEAEMVCEDAREARALRAHRESWTSCA